MNTKKNKITYTKPRTKSKFKRKDPNIKIQKKKIKKRISPKRKDPLKTKNLIERTIKQKKASSCHIVNKTPKKNKAGRQSKLTLKIQNIILNAIRAGMQLKRAFMLAGISNQTYYNWIESGRLEADRIRKELSEARKLAIENKELNHWKVQESENWTDNKIKELNPNKYFDFLICVERENARCEMDNLNCIAQAKNGGEYIAETVIEKDEDDNIIKKSEIRKYMKPDWRAARWHLKKTLPDIYADRQILAHEGEIQSNQNVEHNHTITVDKSPDNIASVLGLLIETGFIKGKLIEHCEPEPKLIEVIDTKTN